MYKFVHVGNMVIAITTYAGKTVKAYAKCHSSDAFDQEFGEKLAKARCNVKVAKKRAARARKKYAEAEHLLAQAENHVHKMASYMTDSAEAVVTVEKELQDLLNQVK